MLPLQAQNTSLMARHPPPDAVQRQGQAPLPLQPRRRPLHRAVSLRQGRGSEPHLHCQGQDRHPCSDPADGRRHQQRRRLGSLHRLRRLLLHHLQLCQVLHLQTPEVRRPAMQPGTFIHISLIPVLQCHAPPLVVWIFSCLHGGGST